jgi:hypothetical protein
MTEDHEAIRKALGDSEDAYRKAVLGLGEARSLRAKTIAAALEDGMTLREVAEELDMSSARVQQIFETLWTHRVGFVGTLDDGAAKALQEAGMALRFSTGGGTVAPGGELPAPNKHGIYLVAESEEEAVKRVKEALEVHGEFFTFSVTPTVGKKDPV